MKLDELVEFDDHQQVQKSPYKFKNIGLEKLVKKVQIDDKEKDKDVRVTQELFQKTQLIDLLILMIISLGTALCTCSYSLEFEGMFGFKTQAFLLINMGFSVVCCLFVYLREKIYLRMSKNKGTAKATDDLTSTKRTAIIIFECSLIMIHPYPFFVGIKHVRYNEFAGQDIYYYVNDYFQLFSLLRFAYTLGSALNVTIWKSSSAYRVW